MKRINEQYGKMPFKSVAAALLFSALLGPIGLLYASFWGGFFMITVGIIVVPSLYVVPIILLWVFSCIWAVGAVESHNKKVAYVQSKTSINA